MGYLGLFIAGIGLILLIWIVAISPQRKNRESDAGAVTEGKIVHLKEWMHEGHRRCQVEYAYRVAHPESDEEKILRGKSNCVPKIFDQLELNMPLTIRYLPENPEFSRPVFDN